MGSGGVAAENVPEGLSIPAGPGGASSTERQGQRPTRGIDLLASFTPAVAFVEFAVGGSTDDFGPAVESYER
jgi:hypothetical protein